MIINDVNSKRWEQANKDTEQLSKAWKKVVNRVQFSSEIDEINAFNVNLARIKGAIMAKDNSGALMELNEALEHWTNIGK